MSWQKNMLNLGLRLGVKPIVTRSTFSHKEILLGRQRLAKQSINSPVPGYISLQMKHLNGVLCEHLFSTWEQAEKSYQRPKAILYLHGGGYVTCSPSTHRAITYRLAKYAECDVYAINYRKAPEHPFPAALGDAIAAYRWLLDTGYRANDIVIAGDSAGGNLTLVTLLQVRELDLPQPGGAICLSPWTDLTLSSPSYRKNAGKEVMLPAKRLDKVVKHFTAGADPRHPLISPVFAEFHGIAPLMIHVGTTEILYDDARLVADAAKRDGVKVDYNEWHDAPHVLPLFTPWIPEANQCLQKMVGFSHACFEEKAIRIQAA